MVGIAVVPALLLRGLMAAVAVPVVAMAVGGERGGGRLDTGSSCV